MRARISGDAQHLVTAAICVARQRPPRTCRARLAAARAKRGCASSSGHVQRAWPARCSGRRSAMTPRPKAPVPAPAVVRAAVRGRPSGHRYANLAGYIFGQGLEGPIVFGVTAASPPTSAELARPCRERDARRDDAGHALRHACHLPGSPAPGPPTCGFEPEQHAHEPLAVPTRPSSPER
jgi:hypothetical protein